MVYQYAEFLVVEIKKTRFRVYHDKEMFVANLEIVKQFFYRLRSLLARARIKVSVETGANDREVWRLTWKEFNPVNKTLTIIRNRDHRNLTYNICDELMALLLQIPRTDERLFAKIRNSDLLNDTISDYKKILAQETENADFLIKWFS